MCGIRRPAKIIYGHRKIFESEPIRMAVTVRRDPLLTCVESDFMAHIEIRYKAEVAKRLKWQRTGETILQFERVTKVLLGKRSSTHDSRTSQNPCL